MDLKNSPGEIFGETFRKIYNGYNETPMKGIAMFQRRSLQVKLVKDAPGTAPIDASRIHSMTPEEVEELSRKVMRQIAINVGAVVVTKIAVTITLKLIAKKLGA